MTYNDPSRFNRNEQVNLQAECWDCFTSLGLDSANQSFRNQSDKSEVLAPFNSSMESNDEALDYAQMAPMLDKKGVVRFHARCRDQDRQYEINNNGDLDNGVYHKFVYSSHGDTKS